MRAYYNEHDPFAAAWLRNLIAAGLIMPGDVDERDIQAVQPGDVRGYTRCHFFAGIGGWDLALQLAGWPADRPVWTGSCPCQPFSAAGKRGGLEDTRHLWPAWFRLIRECKPPVVFGEQVASKDGRGWLDLVATDLEETGYAFGAADLPAAGEGAPHIRQRLWFVAGFVGHPIGSGLEGRSLPERGRGGECALGPTGGDAGGWSDARWIPCRDGKRRPVPVEPALFPLAHAGEIRNRVGTLRGAGNAIVPAVAAEFIRAFVG